MENKMKLNPELEDLYLTFLKYPYVTTDDLILLFDKIYKNEDVSKTRHRDIVMNIKNLKEHLQHLIDNG
jgi:hypothetical protein